MGFATGDLSRSTSTTLQAAEMLVFSKDECNDNLQTELTKSKACKWIEKNQIFPKKKGLISIHISLSVTLAISKGQFS